MIDSVALRAPTSPPDTGASTAVAPRARARSGDLDRQARLGRRHVDEHGAWLEAAENPGLAEVDLADVGWQARPS
jgi:hypothetical protein